MNLSCVSTRIHCCCNQFISLTTKSSSSRLRYSLTLVDVDFQGATGRIEFEDSGDRLSASTYAFEAFNTKLYALETIGSYNEEEIGEAFVGYFADGSPSDLPFLSRLLALASFGRHHGSMAY